MERATGIGPAFSAWAQSGGGSLIWGHSQFPVFASLSGTSWSAPFYQISSRSGTRVARVGGFARSVESGEGERSVSGTSELECLQSEASGPPVRRITRYLNRRLGTAYWPDRYSASPSPEVRRTRVRCCQGLERTMPSTGARPRCHRWGCRVRPDGLSMLSTHRGWHSRTPDDRAPAGAR